MDVWDIRIEEYIRIELRIFKDYIIYTGGYDNIIMDFKKSVAEL